MFERTSVIEWKPLFHTIDIEEKNIMSFSQFSGSEMKQKMEKVLHGGHDFIVPNLKHCFDETIAAAEKKLNLHSKLKIVIHNYQQSQGEKLKPDLCAYHNS